MPVIPVIDGLILQILNIKLEFVDILLYRIAAD